MIRKIFHSIYEALDIAPVKMFVFIGLTTGLLYVLGTPPYYMLDEPNHFFRAYQVSKGVVIPERRDDKTGGAIPRSLATSVYVFRFGVQEYADGEVPFDLIRGSISQPLNEQDTTFVAFSNTALYSPIPYIPQAAAIALGRAFDLSPLALMYMGRMANLLVAVFLLAIAIQILPVFRWVLFLVVLTPTSMFQIASLNADGMLFSLAFLFLAFIFREAYASASDAHISRSATAMLLITALLFGLCKSAYFMLPALAFLIPGSRFGSWPRRLGFVALLFIVHLGAVGLWSALAAPVYTPFQNPGVNPPLAVQWILQHPVAFAHILVTTLWSNLWFYLHGFAAYQWNQEQILLPDTFAAGYLLILSITALLSGEKNIVISARQKLLLGAVSVLSIIVVLTSVYISWMPPGAPVIDGVQGRYFIPLAIPCFALLYNRRFAISSVESTLAIALPILSFVSLLYGLVMFHRLF